jgi:hypothetical protein
LRPNKPTRAHIQSFSKDQARPEVLLLLEYFNTTEVNIVMVFGWFITSPTAFACFVLISLSLRLEGEENMIVRNIDTIRKTMDSTVHSYG